MKEKLSDVIRMGEGYHVEFKKAPTDLANVFVAFANASGGEIYLGIDDHGALHPVSLSNRLRAELENSALNCDPPISVKVEAWEGIIRIAVPEGSNKPYQSREGFFVRNGSLTQKLKRDQILRLMATHPSLPFDYGESKPLPVEGGCSPEALLHFTQRTGIHLTEKDLPLFQNLHLLASRAPRPAFNNAGILLFSSQAGICWPQSRITCVLFGTDERYDVLDRKDFQSPLALMIEEAMAFLKRNIRIGYRIGSGAGREEVWEYPEVVIREALTNAVIHRDYGAMGGTIQVDLFPYRLEFTNPGGLPQGMKREDLGKYSFQRNPLLADLLYRQGYGEKIGTGIPRMREALRIARLPPPEFQVGDLFFKVVISKSPQRADRKDTLEEKIFSCFRESVYLSSQDLASLTGVSHDTVWRALGKLLIQKKVVRVGKGRATRYIIAT